jgi:NADH-quinone oxidoreductase subunit J
LGLNEVLFSLAAIAAIVTAIAVVFTKKTQYAALFFVTHLMALASIYALLDAPVLAVLQIMVYAGAVMVVFVFAIMILDADELEKLMPANEGRSFVAASLVVLALVGGFFGFANRFDIAKALAPAATAGTSLATDNAAVLARVLYKDYASVFELVGLLLLVAVVGIMVMAKRRLD